MRSIRAGLLVAGLGLGLAACLPYRSPKTLAEMSPSEVEVANKVLESACRDQGISRGSRSFDQCRKVEAVKRGYTRYERR